MILIDTHVLIWWADGNQQRLSQQALAAIEVEIESARRIDALRSAHQN